MLRCTLAYASIGLALGQRSALLSEVNAQYESLNSDVAALQSDAPQVKSMAFMSVQGGGGGLATPPSFEALETERNFLSDVKGTMGSNNNIFVENSLVTKTVQVSQLNNFFAQQTEVVQELERLQSTTMRDGYGNPVLVTRQDFAKAMFKYSVEVITAGCQDVSLFVASKQATRANFYRKVTSGIYQNGARDAYAYTCVTQGGTFESQMIQQLNFAHLDTNAPIVQQCMDAQVIVRVQVFIRVETTLCVYTPVNPIYPHPRPPLPPVFPPVFPPVPPVFPPVYQCKYDHDCVAVGGRAVCINYRCEVRKHCPHNMKWNHHKCVCKRGYKWNNHKRRCVPRKHKRCGKHQRWNGHKCVCKNGYKWNPRHHRCVPRRPHRPHRCHKKEKWSNRKQRCVCKRNYRRRNGKCVKRRH